MYHTPERLAIIQKIRELRALLKTHNAIKEQGLETQYNRILRELHDLEEYLIGEGEFAEPPEKG